MLTSAVDDTTVLRLLAEPLRLQLLQLLAREQLCTCHLVEETGAGQTNVSNHLRALRHAGLVETEPCGRFTYYRLAPGALDAVHRLVGDLAVAATAGAPKRPC